MKFKVTMKDPDVLHDAIQEAAEKYAKSLGLDADETEAMVEMRREKTAEACGYWFEYGEYLTVEVDTDKMTCEVVSCKK